ncbi:helix-turn-helix domain-containing protein [Sulfurovum sp.]
MSCSLTKQILKAYKEGYSQHRVAKVLNISQPAIYGVIKRNKQ